MAYAIRILAILAVSLLVAFATARGLRALYPAAWARPRLRRAILAAIGAWIAVTLAHSIAALAGAPRTVSIVLMLVSMVALAALVVHLPFLWLGAWIRRRVERHPAQVSRRELVLTAARLAPLGGAAFAGLGALGAAARARLVEVELSFPELPPALEGFRILQYSDVHLGPSISFADVEALVALGTKTRADLVLLTGDLADDLALLPRTLELFASLAPPHGVFASAGNHEYFRGLPEVRRLHDRSAVPFLLESGHTLDVGGAKLHLSGADDPAFSDRQGHEFFERSVQKALDGAPSDAFHVLMSHRPDGFPAARAAGVQLTLSGHTHGAQLGIGGRSLFEPLLPERYLWGPYREGTSRLYTTSGAGHWVPFRLGCPREVAVIKLVRGPIESRAVLRRLG